VKSPENIVYLRPETAQGSSCGNVHTDQPGQGPVQDRPAKSPGTGAGQLHLRTREFKSRWEMEFFIRRDGRRVAQDWIEENAELVRILGMARQPRATSAKEGSPTTPSWVDIGTTSRSAAVQELEG